METSGSEVVRVLAALEAAGVDAAITGGWGVDALLGRQTRPHGDVDVGIAATNVDRAIDALAAIGYALHEDRRPARIVLRARAGVVDLHPIAWTSTGEGVQQGFDDVVITYPVGSLDALGTIAGETVRCGTPELQLAFHESAAPRPTDRQDMALLAAAFDLHLPQAYR